MLVGTTCRQAGRIDCRTPDKHRVCFGRAAIVCQNIELRVFLTNVRSIEGLIVRIVTSHDVIADQARVSPKLRTEHIGDQAPLNRNLIPGLNIYIHISRWIGVSRSIVALKWVNGVKSNDSGIVGNDRLPDENCAIDLCVVILDVDTTALVSIYSIACDR